MDSYTLYAKTCNFRQPDVKKNYNTLLAVHWCTANENFYNFFKEKDGMIMWIYISKIGFICDGIFQKNCRLNSYLDITYKNFDLLLKSDFEPATLWKKSGPKKKNVD